nr:gustatory receptor 42 [Papilio memnon]
MTKVSVDNLIMDILDDDFVQIFKPIHIMQYLLGTLQVKIKYGFVTTTSYGYDVFSIFVWLIHIISMFVFIVYCESSTDSILTDFYLKLGHILNGLIIAMVTIKNFYNGNSSSQLYVKLQKIDRDLGMKNSIKLNKRVSVLSKVFVGMFFICSVVCVVWSIVLYLYVMNMKVSCAVVFIVELPILGNYMDMILIFFQMYFIVLRFECVVTILKEKINTHVCVAKKIETFFVSKELCTDEKMWSRLTLSLRDFINALDDLINVHQFTIFGLTCEFIILDIILIQSIITTIKQQMSINIYSLINIIPVVTLLLFILLLSVMVEIIKSKISNSRKLCTNILRFSIDAARNDIKQILLLLEVKEISIYDIYSLDGQLPLNLVAITATYTIVLLQFALLL